MRVSDLTPKRARSPHPLALFALTPVYAITTVALIALDVVTSLRDIRRADRAGAFDGWRP